MGYGQVFQAVQKGRCVVLFAGPETGIHLAEIYRTTGKDVPLLHELVKEFGAAKPPVEVIENDTGIQQNGAMGIWFRRMASSNRSSGSERIFSTWAAPPWASSV